MVPLPEISERADTEVAPTYARARTATAYQSSTGGGETMIGSMVRNFQDPWDHQAFFRGSNMKVLVTAAGEYRSAVTRIDLHSLWMQRNETLLPQVAYVEEVTNRCAVTFAANLQGPPPYRNGDELLPDMVMVSSLMGDHHFRMAGESQVAMMSLLPDDLAAVSHALLGRELTAPKVTHQTRVSDRLVVRLQQLHNAACHLAAQTPDILAHSEVARAVEDKLVRAMVACLAQPTIAQETARPHLRMPVMRRFERAVCEAEDRPLYLTEVCAKIGVHERTLRNHCHEYLGMSPHRYLWLRRMKQVQRTLRLSNPGEKTVTMIANDCGFWELGRFSVAYRKLFGETPSATLRGTAERADSRNPLW